MRFQKQFFIALAIIMVASAFLPMLKINTIPAAETKDAATDKTSKVSSNATVEWYKIGYFTTS